MDKQERDDVERLSLDEAYDGIDNDYNRWVGVDVAGKPVEVIGKDFMNGLKRIHRFVDWVIRLDEPAFRFFERSGRRMAQRTRLSNVPTGALVTHEFRQHYDLSEQVKIFLEAEDQLGLGSELSLFEPLRECPTCPGKLIGELANELVQLIRRKSKSKNFRRRLARRRFEAEENFRRGKSLIDALFASCSKLNVLRLDLEYLRENRPSLEQAKEHFSRFLNNSRRNFIFRYVLARIWHLEWGSETGYHFHLIVFLKGSKTRTDITDAHNMGNYWVHDITEGHGRYHNCNSDKHKYRNLGIGLISRHDQDKRDVLVNTVLRYLTKMDELVKPRVPKGTRTFQTSRMPKPHSGKGRKRRP